jgi:hypothetical protein
MVTWVSMVIRAIDAVEPEKFSIILLEEYQNVRNSIPANEKGL